MKDEKIPTSFPALMQSVAFISPIMYFALGVHLSVKFDALLLFLMSVGFGAYFSYSAWRRVKEQPASLATFSLSWDNAYLADFFDKTLMFHAVIFPVASLLYLTFRQGV